MLASPSRVVFPVSGVTTSCHTSSTSSSRAAIANGINQPLLSSSPPVPPSVVPVSGHAGNVIRTCTHDNKQHQQQHPVTADPPTSTTSQDMGRGGWSKHQRWTPTLYKQGGWDAHASSPKRVQLQQPSGDGMMSSRLHFTDRLSSHASQDIIDGVISQDAKTTSAEENPIGTRGFHGNRPDEVHNKINGNWKAVHDDPRNIAHSCLNWNIPTANPNTHALTVQLPGRASSRTFSGTVCTGDPRAHPSERCSVTWRCLHICR